MADQDQSEKNNRCPSHPEETKEYVCEKCQTIYCKNCYQLDKAHKSKIFPLSDKLLEDYEFLKFLGGGTFGKCFKVKSLSDGQELALKVIKDVDDAMFQIVKKEAQFLCSLSHKYVVKYTYSFRVKDEEIFGILMELAEGCLLDKIDTMTQEDALKYFKQICEGMYYLHVEVGIVHRDLKPGNILMKGDDCKICDFGEAKKMNKEFTKLSNAQGFGTEAFLPPEVIDGKDYGFKADIWALGIILYKMLTKGGHPFNPTNDKNLDLKQSVRKNEISISEDIKNPLLLELLKGCLAHDDKERFEIKQILEVIRKSEKPLEESPKKIPQTEQEQKSSPPVPIMKQKCPELPKQNGAEQGQNIASQTQGNQNNFNPYPAQGGLGFGGINQQTGFGGGQFGNTGLGGAGGFGNNPDVLQKPNGAEQGQNDAAQAQGNQNNYNPGAAQGLGQTGFGGGQFGRAGLGGAGGFGNNPVELQKQNGAEQGQNVAAQAQGNQNNYNPWAGQGLGQTGFGGGQYGRAGLGGLGLGAGGVGTGGLGSGGLGTGGFGLTGLGVGVLGAGTFGAGFGTGGLGTSGENKEGQQAVGADPFGIAQTSQLMGMMQNQLGGFQNQFGGFQNPNQNQFQGYPQQNFNQLGGIQNPNQNQFPGFPQQNFNQLGGIQNPSQNQFQGFPPQNFNQFGGQNQNHCHPNQYQGNKSNQGGFGQNWKT